MNAIQPSRPPLKPDEPRRSPQKKSQRSRRPNPYRVIALETTAKLTVNVVLSAAAVYGLCQLLHYQWFQQEKLQEVRTEVKLTQERVNLLRTDFDRYFDPLQAKSVMQEQSNRVETGQRQIILLDKNEESVSSRKR